MKLFILAAGKGSRLYPLTKDKPKSLIQLRDGSTLLERQIEVAADSGAFECIHIITGYLSHMIEERIATYREQRVEVVYNPYWDVSNNLLSLWTAHYLMLDSDFVISNGDNIYKKGIYRSVIEGAGDDVIQLTIDTKERYDDDDMKVLLGRDKSVQRVSKLVTPEAADAESLGLVLVKGKESRGIFHSELMRLVRRPEMMNAFWLEIFNSLAENGHVVRSCEVSSDCWAEVDYHPDIKALQEAISAKLFD